MGTLTIQRSRGCQTCSEGLKSNEVAIMKVCCSIARSSKPIRRRLRETVSKSRRLQLFRCPHWRQESIVHDCPDKLRDAAGPKVQACRPAQEVRKRFRKVKTIIEMELGDWRHGKYRSSHELQSDQWRTDLGPGRLLSGISI